MDADRCWGMQCGAGSHKGVHVVAATPVAPFSPEAGGHFEGTPLAFLNLYNSLTQAADIYNDSLTIPKSLIVSTQVAL